MRLDTALRSFKKGDVVVQVMQIPKNIRPWLDSVPPLHRWPDWLKQIILGFTILLCVAAYLLLIAGLLGTGSLLLQLALD